MRILIILLLLLLYCKLETIVLVFKRDNDKKKLFTLKIN